MLSRFLYLAIFLSVAFGLALHFQVDFPQWASWVGELPGDITITKGNVLIYIPASSAAVVSVVATLVLTALFGNSK
jgi:hypothetical protein